MKKKKGKFELLRLCKSFMQENEGKWWTRRLEREYEKTELIAEWELEERLKKARLKRVKAKIKMRKLMMRKEYRRQR